MPLASAQALQRRAEWIILGAIGLCILLQAWLAVVMEVNWDEFFYLSQIYDHRRGEWTKALQSLHIHILGWVAAVPGNEVDQIVIGRLFMLACFAGTCGFVYWLSRGFVSRLAALMAVLVFASSGFSIIHGASFRADPLAAMLMMGSLAILARAPMTLPALAATALLAAVAAMVTVKVGLYAPAFIGIAVWRLLAAPARRAALLWLGGLGAAAAAMFAALYALQLALVPKASNSGSRAGLGNAAETQFDGTLLPRAREIADFFSYSPFQAMVLLAGLVVALVMLGDRSGRLRAVALIGCGACLLWLAVYRNAFPYFFPFILAPAAVVAGVAADRVAVVRKYALLLVAVMAVVAVVVAASFSLRGQLSQRQLVGAVHMMFPQPVHYIDRNSMLASFPKRGFFMSTWGFQGYVRAGKPVFQPLLDRDTIPMVIVNGPALANALDVRPDAPELITADKAVLRENYIPHWGPVFVAGKIIPATAGGSDFNISVPGAYTVEGADAVIDGRSYRAGETITLQRGRHVVQGNIGSITLRWGRNLPRPAEPFTGPIYHGF